MNHTILKHSNKNEEGKLCCEKIRYIILERCVSHIDMRDKKWF